MSRYERGVTPLTDVSVLRRFARALAIEPGELGLAPAPPGGAGGRGRVAAAVGMPSRAVSSTVAGEPGGRDGDVRRRQLLAALGAAAGGAAAGGGGAPSAAPADARIGEVLVSRVRDAMLGLAPVPPQVSAVTVRAALDRALADFRGSRYGRLSVTCPG